MSSPDAKRVGIFSGPKGREEFTEFSPEVRKFIGHRLLLNLFDRRIIEKNNTLAVFDTSPSQSLINWSTEVLAETNQEYGLGYLLEFVTNDGQLDSEKGRELSEQLKMPPEYVAILDIICHLLGPDEIHNEILKYIDKDGTYLQSGQGFGIVSALYATGFSMERLFGEEIDLPIKQKADMLANFLLICESPEEIIELEDEIREVLGSQVSREGNFGYRSRGNFVTKLLLRLNEIAESSDEGKYFVKRMRKQIVSINELGKKESYLQNALGRSLFYLAENAEELKEDLAFVISFIDNVRFSFADIIHIKAIITAFSDTKEVLSALLIKFSEEGQNEAMNQEIVDVLEMLLTAILSKDAVSLEVQKSLIQYTRLWSGIANTGDENGSDDLSFEGIKEALIEIYKDSNNDEIVPFIIQFLIGYRGSIRDQVRDGYDELKFIYVSAFKEINTDIHQRLLDNSDISAACGRHKQVSSKED